MGMRPLSRLICALLYGCFISSRQCIGDMKLNRLQENVSFFPTECVHSYFSFYIFFLHSTFIFFFYFQCQFVKKVRMLGCSIPFTLVNMLSIVTLFTANALHTRWFQFLFDSFSVTFCFFSSTLSFKIYLCFLIYIILVPLN